MYFLLRFGFLISSDILELYKSCRDSSHRLNTTAVASQLCLSQVWTLLTTFTGLYLMFC